MIISQPDDSHPSRMSTGRFAAAESWMQRAHYFLWQEVVLDSLSGRGTAPVRRQKFGSQGCGGCCCGEAMECGELSPDFFGRKGTW